MSFFCDETCTLQSNLTTAQAFSYAQLWNMYKLDDDDDKLQ